ncbi:MAG: hypothetical protein ABR911_13250 [Syntrophales bacterium]
MRRTEMLQEIRKMRFEEVYFGWSESRLTQEEAARGIGAPVKTGGKLKDGYGRWKEKLFFYQTRFPLSLYFHIEAFLERECYLYKY